MITEHTRIHLAKCLLAAGVAGSAILPQATGGIAMAQQAKAERQVQIDIPAGTLSDTLIALGRQAKVQIAFLPDRVAGRRADALRGSFTVEQALDRALENSGLSYRRMRNGSYVVSGPTKANLEKAQRLAADIASDAGYANGQPNIPEILVTGRRRWSLNTDLPRGEDEAQPYTVFTREQIKRSGSLNLEDFFRDYLGSSVSVRTARQGGGVVAGRDSMINLRGLGIDSTLILVDGRRYAEPNSGSQGTFVQSSVVGIPLEQIERVEVLASSAAGQYGSNAVGGVINIILRRDYQGIELSGYVAGATRGDAIERRLSANATIPVLPKTSLTLSGSWQKSDPLYSADRPFVNERLDFILKNDPRYLDTAPLIFSTTPNIRSANGTPLVLDPQYAVNGQRAIGAATTFIPVGYQGIAIDGAAPLIANAGRQNIEPGTGTTGGPILGDRFRLLTGGTTANLSAALRSDLNGWLSVYGSGSYSRVESTFDTSPVPGSFRLLASAPNNPFTQDIEVSFPTDEPFVTRKAWSDSYQLIGGLIAKLPFKWQANFDVNTSWNVSASVESPVQLATGYYNQLASGQINLLRDTLAYPLDIQYDANNHGYRAPSKSSYTSYTLKFAGPLTFARLWGGKPVVTLVGEVQRQWLGDSLAVTNGPAQSSISYQPERSQNTRSVFGEVVFPVVGPDNHVPLFHEFELRLSGRYDSYSGRSTNLSFTCVPLRPGTLTPEELEDPCPAPNAVIPYRTVRNHSANPVIAAKWGIIRDIALRASYSTGYTPPQLNNVVENQGLAIAGFTSGISVSARDPLRGNERIGEPVLGGALNLVNGVNGGNPDIEPQKSQSWSFGTILTPRFVPGLTLRADWTRIRIDNAYYSPAGLLSARTPQEQAGFEDFLEEYPDRFVRAAPAAGDPFGVGRIIYIDARTINLSRFNSESVDFSGNYQVGLGAGTLTVNGNATLLLKLTSQLTPSAAVRDFTGVVSASDVYGTGDSLKFRGTLSAAYSMPDWSVGVRARYLDGYYLNGTRTVVTTQGSDRVPAQAYLDLFGTVRVLRRTELSVGINNLFDKRPPIDTTRGSGYAPSGDPRLRNFFVNLNQRF
jgi:iron complex outermembrane recepter protein